MRQKLLEVDFNGIKIPKIILGGDPFECFTDFYPSPEEKLGVYSKRFSDLNAIMDIISVAIDGGITALNFLRHKNLVDAAERIRKDKLEMKLIPHYYQIPVKIGDEPVSIDRTEATLYEHLLDSLKSQAFYAELVQRPYIKKIESTSPLSREETQNLKVDKEKLEAKLKWFDERGCIKLVMTCVELFALTSRLDLLEEAVDIFNQFGFTVCAGAHRAEVFEILESEKIHFKTYFAPINKIGFFMFPTKSQMLKHLLKIKEPLIAIKPLAGGRIKPQEAFKYIFGLRENVVCNVGLSSVQEVEETIRAIQNRQLLKNQ